MAILKVKVADKKEIPAIGEHFDTDDQGHIGIVTMSFPEIGDPNILVEVPDEVKGFAALAATDATEGDARDIKSDYFPRWMRGRVDPAEAVEVNATIEYILRDTFELSGVTEAVRQAANYGAGVFACCIDTGIDANHQAFAGKNVKQWSRLNPNYAPDEHGHGTFVLSQLGSDYGILSDAPLGMFQALEGANGRGSEQTVAGAIRAAADYIQALGLPQDRVSAIVSMSLGGSDSSVIKAATQYLLRLPNVKVFCAAGNDGPGADVGSPANTPTYNGNSVYCVGAANRDFSIAPFSTGGTIDPRISGVQFGVQIIGAARGTVNGTLAESGTSMATPYAAGLAGCHAAMGRSMAEIDRLISTQRQHQLNPPAQNGKGVLQLAQEDFGQAQQPPAPTPDPMPEPIPAPAPAPAPVPVPIETIVAVLDGNIASLDRARFTTRATDNEFAWNEVGVAATSLKTLKDMLTQPPPTQQPPTQPPPTQPPPPIQPPPTNETVKPGGVATFKYLNDNDPQHRLVVRRPNGPIKCVVVCFNGGGWMSDDAIPLWSHWEVEVRQVTNWFVQQNTLFVEAFYDVGDAERSYRDGLAAVRFVLAHCKEWGGNPDRVAISGHSAGGWIALRVALTQQVWRVFTMAGAIPSLDGAQLPAMTYQILQQTWGPQQNWNSMTPKTHLDDGGRLKGVLFHGTYDDQIPVGLMEDFAANAIRKGHTVERSFQTGGSHFSIVPTSSRVTENRLIQMFNEA